MAQKILLILFIFLSQACNCVFASPYDSTGLRKEGNLTFIIHRVEQGETVYSLSRRYGVSQEILIRDNPFIRNGLKIGDELKVMLSSTVSQEKQPQQATIHTVQPSETLFAIARKYGVSVDQVKKWNDLENNNISVGQKIKIFPSRSSDVESIQSTATPGAIHIVNQGETLYSISKLYNISTDSIRHWNSLTGNDIRIGQELIVRKPVAVAESNANAVIANDLKLERRRDTERDNKPGTETRIKEIIPEKKVEKEGEFQKVVEKGMAEIIAGSESTKKYLAMHRSAPIGTIMQVRNEMNNLTVFVRVIGKLPDTGENTNVSIRISKTAFDRLGAIDRRFPVEITYLP
jgi:LysM repeat protein